MKNIMNLFVILLGTLVFAQTGKVGVNTNNPTETLDVNGSLRVRSINEATSLTTVKDSVLVVNGLGKVQRAASKDLFSVADDRILLLNRAFGGSFQTGNNTFYNLPVGSNTNDIQYVNTDYFEILGDGKVKVLKAGIYLITGELSVTNMPQGSIKYILGLFINNVRRGYLSRGFSTAPSVDYWGTTGTIMYKLNANDIVEIKQVINAGNINLNANFMNIGIKAL